MHGELGNKLVSLSGCAKSPADDNERLRSSMPNVHRTSPTYHRTRQNWFALLLVKCGTLTEMSVAYLNLSRERSTLTMINQLRARFLSTI